MIDSMRGVPEVQGTIGYMAPEHVQRGTLDHLLGELQPELAADYDSVEEALGLVDDDPADARYHADALGKATVSRYHAPVPERSRTTTQPCPQPILDLIERFDLHADTYRQQTYNETQVRREFIDPFFAGLGWDVDNESGHAEAYKDVIHEDAIKVGGSTKAPDYCFRIGGVQTRPTHTAIERGSGTIRIARNGVRGNKVRRP